MTRRILTVLVTALLVIVVVERIRIALPKEDERPPTVTPPPAPATPKPDLTLDSRRSGPTRETTAVTVTDATGASAGLDAVIRLDARRRLRAAPETHYLDSLLVTTDSVLRRWPSQKGTLTIAIVPGGPAAFTPTMVDYVREAVQTWNPATIQLQAVETQDTAAADVVVRWIDHFPFARGGQTDVTSDRAGQIVHASVNVAVNDSAGQPLPIAAVRAVTLHEVGHALGLPHSPVVGDIMYPTAEGFRLSDRDQASLALLYDLPVGSIRGTD